jgi:hypothetical protein
VFIDVFMIGRDPARDKQSSGRTASAVGELLSAISMAGAGSLQVLSQPVRIAESAEEALGVAGEDFGKGVGSIDTSASTGNTVASLEDLPNMRKIVENLSKIPSFAANRIEKTVIVVKIGVDTAAAIPGAASRTADSLSFGVASLGRGATSLAGSAGRTAEAIAGIPASLARVGVALVDVSGRPVRAAQLAGTVAGAAVEGLSRGAVGIRQRVGVTIAIPGKVAQGLLDGVSALGHAA